MAGRRPAGGQRAAAAGIEEAFESKQRPVSGICERAGRKIRAVGYATGSDPAPATRSTWSPFATCGTRCDSFRLDRVVGDGVRVRRAEPLTAGRADAPSIAKEIAQRTWTRAFPLVPITPEDQLAPMLGVHVHRLKVAAQETR